MNIKTKIHTYKYNIDNQTEATAYDALRAKLKDGRHWMHANAGAAKDRLTFDSEDIELETKFLFSNQWNTACGKRVFDHYEGIFYNNGRGR